MIFPMPMMIWTLLIHLWMSNYFSLVHLSHGMGIFYYIFIPKSFGLILLTNIGAFTKVHEMYYLIIGDTLYHHSGDIVLCHFLTHEEVEHAFK